MGYYPDAFCNRLKYKPVNLVETSSVLLVSGVSQLAQENRRVPPMWLRNILPILLLKQTK